MQGRRKHPRFLLSEPVDGNLHLRDEVSIETWGDEEVVVLSPEPQKPGDRLSLEVPGRSRHRTHVRVLESRPAVAGDGVLRHRLTLAIEGRPGNSPVDGADKT